MRKAIEICGASLIGSPVSHRFEPQGVTVLALLSESHFSIHTYPERGFCAMDMYVCGNADAELGVRYMIDVLAPTEIHVRTFERGVAE
jgi:S-adenosylmethionine decarboxylase